MTDDGRKRMLITPPPGLLPPIPSADDHSSHPVNTGSATRRIGSPQLPAPAFFPAVPGAAAPGTAEPGTAAPTLPVPAAPAPPATSGADAPTGDWQLVLPGGSRHALPPTGLVLGRNPVAPRSWPDAESLALDDPARTVSKSHAVVVPADRGLTVVDLRSTNGTAVVHEGKSRIITGETVVDGELTLVLGSFAVTIERG